MSLESYSRASSGLQRYEVRGMGTTHVLLVGGAPRKVLQQGAQEAFDTLERLEHCLSKFLPDSDLSVLNRLGAVRPVAVGYDLKQLLVRAREAWELTDGVFDPSVGALMEAWGLVEMDGRIPPEDEIATLAGSHGMDRVIISDTDGTVRLDRKGISLDLGGLAKGYAVDRVVEGLKGRGIPRGAMISGRSSVVVWGSAPGGESWRFDVAHPSNAEETLKTIVVEPGAVSTSGTGERRFQRGGREYGHVLDPRSGRPAAGVRAATVWTRDALLGDVLSTTLLILGPSALEVGGAARRLAEAWRGGTKRARASALLVVDNPRVWGGIEVVTVHVGEPGFETSGGDGPEEAPGLS